MPLFDLPHPQLVQHQSGTAVPEDLRAFWSATLATARSAAVEPTLVPVDTGLCLVETWDLTFSGFGGDPIRGWFHLPAGHRGPLPVVMKYQGYGGGRGLPHRVPLWALAGYACIEVDTRGQGSASSPGDTADSVGAAPAYPGYMTRGLLDPEDFYFRRVYTDAVLAVDAARRLPKIDPSRIAVTGGSQGGGISLAVAGLRDDLAAVVADVPFLSDFRRGCEVAAKPPYTEISAYLRTHRDHVQQAFATLAYFDASVLGRMATAPALFSVALMDQTCPPSTVYAAYNAYAGPKRITEYPFNDHEGGEAFHEAETLSFLAAKLKG